MVNRPLTKKMSILELYEWANNNNNNVLDFEIVISHDYYTDYIIPKLDDISLYYEPNRQIIIRA